MKAISEDGTQDELAFGEHCQLTWEIEPSLRWYRRLRAVNFFWLGYSYRQPRFYPVQRFQNVIGIISPQNPLVRTTKQGPAFRVLAAPNALGDAGLDLGPTGLVEGNTERLRTRRRSTLVRRLGPGN